jgi:putative membrane protein
VCNAFGFHFVVNARSVTGIITLLIGVAVWGLLNATLGKILKILTLPLSCLTLGLFSLVVNAAILLLAAELDLGFAIADHGGKKFFTALVASILIALLSGMLGMFLPDDDE